jgi:hypothetical protein
MEEVQRAAEFLYGFCGNSVILLILSDGQVCN